MAKYVFLAGKGWSHLGYSHWAETPQLLGSLSMDASSTRCLLIEANNIICYHLGKKKLHLSNAQKKITFTDKLKKNILLDASLFLHFTDQKPKLPWSSYEARINY